MFKGLGMEMAVLEALNQMSAIRRANMQLFNFGFRGASKRRKTGDRYPHSSTRQRARYARQLAAGQLNIGRVEVTPEPVKKTRARRKVAADV